jgi:hypothetical protein
MFVPNDMLYVLVDYPRVMLKPLFNRQLGLTKLSLELLGHYLRVFLVNRVGANGILYTYTYVQISMCIRNRLKF